MISQPIEERYRSKDYWTGILQLELFKLLNEYKKEKGLSQNGLAAELGFSKSYLSQVLNGNFDHRLSKLVELALAIGKIPEVNYRDIDTVVKEAKGEYDSLHLSFSSKPQSVTIEQPATSNGAVINSRPTEWVRSKEAA